MKRYLLKNFFLCGLLFLFTGTGCTHLVTVKPEETGSNGKEKLPFNVGLYVSEKTDSYAVSENKMGDTWNFHNLGKATVETFIKKLENNFTFVRIIKDKNTLFLDSNKDLLIIIEPFILNYSFDIPMMKMQIYPSKIQFKMTVYTPDGYILFSTQIVAAGDMKGRLGFDFADNPSRAAAKAIQNGVDKAIDELYNDKNFIALINGEDISDNLLVADMSGSEENEGSGDGASMEDADTAAGIEQKETDESLKSGTDKDFLTLRGFCGITFIPALMYASVLTDSLPVGFMVGGSVLFGDLADGWRIGTEMAYLPILNIQTGSDFANITSIPLILYFDIGFIQIGGGVTFFVIDQTILDEDVPGAPSFTLFNGFCLDIPVSDFINFHCGLASYWIYDETQDVIPFLIAFSLRGGISIDF